MNKSTLLKSRTKRARGQTQPPRREDWDHVRFARNIPAKRISWVSFLNPTDNVDMHPEDSSQGEAGFSLLELIVVVLMIAILSAIAAPGWLAFVNRQRVAKVNDRVWSALQEAQQQAKRTKLSYSASFRNNNGVLEVATHRTFDQDGETINSNNAAWKSLGGELEIKPNQVLLCSNIGTDFNTKSALNCNLSAPRTITFNYLGNLAATEAGAKADTPLIVTAGIPQSNNSNAVIEATKRCVQVKTLIGSMQVGQGEDECVN